MGDAVNVVEIRKSDIFEPCRNQLNLEERSGEKVSQLARSTLESVGKQITLTNALLTICIATHAVSLLYPDVGDRLVEKGCFYLPKILEGEVWRLVTSQLLHANALHLAANMYALYQDGEKIETKWGARGFAAVAAMAIGAKVLAFSLFSSKAAGIGLSGVLYGIEGALVASAFKSGSKTEESLKSAAQFVISEYCFEKAMGMVGVQIGVIAHISGFVSGMLFGQFVPPNKGVQNEELLEAPPLTEQKAEASEPIEGKSPVPV